MSTLSNISDFDEELDYEVDEDELLESQESDEENLVKQMKSTVVTPPSPATSTKEIPKFDEPLSDVAVVTSVHPPNFRCPNEFWLKSISTLTTVMNGATSNSVVDVNDTLQEVATCQVKEEVEELEELELLQTEIADSKKMQEYPTPEQLKIDVLESKQVNHDLMELNHVKQDDMANKLKDFCEMNGSIETNDSNYNGLMIDLSSKYSTPPLKFSLMQNSKKSISACLAKDETKLSSIISNGEFTNGDIENVKYFEYEPLVRPAMNPITPAMNPITQPVVSKKIPFIIKAQTVGDAISRKVMVNPIFDGFSENNLLNDDKIVNRKRQRSHNGGLGNIDLRDIVINKRRALNIAQSCPGKKEDNNLPSSNKVAMEIDGENDEEYLSKIENQKLEREKVLREKELRRLQQGWRFSD